MLVSSGTLCDFAALIQLFGAEIEPRRTIDATFKFAGQAEHDVSASYLHIRFA